MNEIREIEQEKILDKSRLIAEVVFLDARLEGELLDQLSSLIDTPLQ